MQTDKELGEIRNHPRFNPDSGRIELLYSELLRLAIKEISSKGYYELATHFDFNPVCCYPPKFVLLDKEIGHDRNFRYILKGLK